MLGQGVFFNWTVRVDYGERVLRMGSVLGWSEDGERVLRCKCRRKGWRVSFEGGGSGRALL